MRWLVGLAALLVADSAWAQKPSQPLPLSTHAQTAKAQREVRSYFVACEVATRADPDDLESCRSLQQNFERIYVRAKSGDADSIRRIALNLADDNPLIIAPNLLQGCAWSMVLYVLPGSGGQASDERMMQRICGRLDPANVERARSRASTIGHEILGSPARPLPEQASNAPPTPSECLDGTAQRLEDYGKPSPPHPKDSAACKAALARQRASAPAR